jgi:hypothetical protein
MADKEIKDFIHKDNIDGTEKLLIQNDNGTYNYTLVDDIIGNDPIDYESLSNKPVIPVNTSDLVNDSGFITAITKDKIISGDIHYSGTNMNYISSDIVYMFNDQVYTVPSNTYTLDEGYASNDRFDIFYVNTMNNSVEIVKGDDTINAEIPYNKILNPDDLVLLVVFIPTQTTDMNSVIDTRKIYDENVGDPMEFTAVQHDYTGTPIGVIDFEHTADHKTGTKCIYSNTNRRRSIRFNTSQPVYVNTYQKLYVNIKLKQPINTSTDIYLYAIGTSTSPAIKLFSKSITLVDRNNTTDWQTLIIPTSLFTLLQFNSVIFRMYTNIDATQIEYLLDDVYLTSEELPNVNQEAGYIEVYKSNVLQAAVSKLNFTNGTNTSVETIADVENDKINIKYNVPDANFKVLYFGNNTLFPTSGTINKIYVDKQNSTLYLWNGTDYVLISGGGGSGDYLPLTGTENNKPISGDVELLDDSDIKFYFDASKIPGGHNTMKIEWLFDTGINLSTSMMSEETSLLITPPRIILSSNASSDGLRGNRYFGANYVNTSYVQKKYVDDNTSNINMGSGDLTSDDIDKVVWNDNGVARLMIKEFSYNTFELLLNSSFTYPTLPRYNMNFAVAFVNDDNLVYKFDDGNVSYDIFNVTFKASPNINNQNEVNINGNQAQNLSNRLLYHTDMNSKFFVLTNSTWIVPVVYDDLSYLKLYKNGVDITSQFVKTTVENSQDAALIDTDFFKYYNYLDLAIPDIHITIRDLIEKNSIGNTYPGGYAYNFNNIFVPETPMQILQSFIANIKNTGLTYTVEQIGNTYKLLLTDNNYALKSITNKIDFISFKSNTWTRNASTFNTFNNKPVGTLKSINNSIATVDTGLTVKVNLSNPVVLPTPNNNSDLTLGIDDGGTVSLTNNLQEYLPYLEPLESGSNSIYAKWHDYHVNIEKDIKIHNIVYVSDIYGDNVTGEAGNINKPFKSIPEAIMHVQLNYSEVISIDNQFLIHVFPGTYKNVVTLQNYINIYYSAGCIQTFGFYVEPGRKHITHVNVTGYLEYIKTGDLNDSERFIDISSKSYINFQFKRAKLSGTIYSPLIAMGQSDTTYLSTLIMNCEEIDMSEVAYYGNGLHTTIRANSKLVLNVLKDINVPNAFDLRSNDISILEVTARTIILNNNPVNSADSKNLVLCNGNNKFVTINADIVYLSTANTGAMAVFRLNALTTFSMNGNIYSTQAQILGSFNNNTVSFNNCKIYVNGLVNKSVFHIQSNTKLTFNNCFIKLNSTHPQMHFITITKNVGYEPKININNTNIYFNINDTYLTHITDTTINTPYTPLYLKNTNIYYLNEPTVNPFYTTNLNNNVYNIQQTNSYSNIDTTTNTSFHFPVNEITEYPDLEIFDESIYIQQNANKYNI